MSRFRPAPPEELAVYGVTQAEAEPAQPRGRRTRRAAEPAPAPAPVEQPVETPAEAE